jgi:isoquinoline 1-oxidoreductase beta subunit
MTSIKVNGKDYEVDAPSTTPLLWVLREHLGLKGTKYGCGIAQCGACTVLLDGQPTRSCVTTLSSVKGKEIVTIEGLSADGMHPVQQAWIEDEVPQCGYCQSGQIIAAVALLSKIPIPNDDDINKAMSGILCRCGTYQRIKRAIRRAGEIAAAGGARTLWPVSREPGTAPSFPFNPFVAIGNDESVVLFINKTELGQGVYTSLAMLVAEELECPWENIRIAPAPVDPAYAHPIFGIQLTGGSMSVSSEWERLRTAGADVREMLIAAAAATWQVDPASCHAEKGRIIHGSGKALTYGQLAEKAATMPAPAHVELKEAPRFSLFGKPIHRIDTPSKDNGEALFGIDINPPGTLTALIARPPVFGGLAKSFDDAKARSITGVQEVVQLRSGIAVVARDFWSANLGRKALETEWDEGAAPQPSTAAMRQEYKKLSTMAGIVARQDGDIGSAFQTAQKQITAEYEVPYLAHAAMEPLNCFVDLRDDGCSIWTGTQFQSVDRNAAATVTGLNPEKVRIHTTLAGGGFGRRANPKSDFVVEAAELAMAVKKPVRVVWTREDDMAGGYYRPMWYDRISAGIDSLSNIVAWRHTIVGQSILKGSPFAPDLHDDAVDIASVEGASDLPYRIPHILVDLHNTSVVVPVQWWRSVGHSHTAFVVESFLDEIAHAAGVDPLKLRQSLLTSDQRQKGVLEMAAEKARWGSPVMEGHGRGIAVHESFGSYVAQVAEVSVKPDGDIKVHKVVCAVDCGQVINPDTVRAQMEGGIVFGLSAALFGAITLKDGRVEQHNFNSYRILRMEEMPEIEVHIMSSEEAPSGVGEPGVPPIAPAVTNAIFALTGKRIRQLPIAQQLREME